MTPHRARAQRLAMPLARNVVRELAISHGGCIRPIQLRRTDLDTGQAEQVLVPCGHTLAAVCPACAERKRALRAVQCREGWHLDAEPTIEPDDPDDVQLTLGGRPPPPPPPTALPAPPPPQDPPPDDREDLHQRGRQDVPPVDVHHLDL